MIRFVDMWVLDRIKFMDVPLRLLLLERRDLKAQWADPCLGITESRVRASILSLYFNNEISILKPVADGIQPSGARALSREDENLIQSASFDEVVASNILIRIAPKGLESWARWGEYDWNNHTSFQSDDVASYDTPGWLEIKSASWRKLLFEIRHSPDRSATMLKPSNATCVVIAQWSVRDFMALPWCFCLRSPAFDINLASDVDLETSEGDVERFCSRLADAFAKWDLSGRAEVPFDPLSRVSQ